MSKTAKAKPNDSTLLTRACEIRAEEIRQEERLIRVSFSSEQPVLRQTMFDGPWVEVLGHSASEVNLERLNASAPVLYNHRRGEHAHRIGVVERAWVQESRGYAELRISKRDDIAGIWQDIRDGILRNVSVAYQIDERQLVEEHADAADMYRITRWTPMEISLVDIPADHTVGVGRSLENPSQPKEDKMPKQTTPETATQPDKQPDLVRNIASPELDTNAIREEARTDFMRQEKIRRDEIRAVFEPFMESHRDLAVSCIADPEIATSMAREKLLSALGKNKEPMARQPVIHIGATDLEKFSRAAEDALEIRAGLKPQEGLASGLAGYSLTELSRKLMEIRGEDTGRWDKRELVGRAFTHSSSDFGAILANVAHKAVLKGYTEAPEVFDKFTRKGVVSDFKTHDRVGLSEFGQLDQIPESGEYKYGTFSEQKEQIQAHTYGKLFSITRKAIINDDLSMFTEIPRKMGAAARRKIGDLVFAVLTSNPTMSDGTALFHANHNNLASSGAAPTVDTVDAVIAAMATQKDYAGEATLNITPAYFIVPYALRGKAKVLMTSETDPSQANSRKPNSVRDVAEVIADARLDAVSSTAWFMLANPSAFDTIEVVYLDGNEMPFLEQQEGWHVDGAEFKVRHDFGVKALDWRTMYKNPGN
jgi:phage head maturation protease